MRYFLANNKNNFRLRANLAKRGRWIALYGLVLALVSCSAQTDDLQAWVDLIRRNATGKPEKLPPEFVYKPFEKDGFSTVNPFSPQRLLALLKQRGGAKKSGPTPDFSRRQESLEAFPIDTIQMIGRLHNEKSDVGVVRVGSSVYGVRLGNYMGKDFGRVTKIEEDAIYVKELVPDSLGDWTEREVVLKLSEATKAS